MPENTLAPARTRRRTACGSPPIPELLQKTLQNPHPLHRLSIFTHQRTAPECPTLTHLSRALPRGCKKSSGFEPHRDPTGSQNIEGVTPKTITWLASFREKSPPTF